MDLPAMIWLGLMLVFLIVEAVCPLHLVSIWFAAGALVAMIVSLMSGPVWLQISLFLAVSCVVLGLMWPFVRKFLNPSLQKTNLDSVIGSEGLVTVPIDNLSGQGQVKLGSMEWTARSTSGAVIEAGAVIRVDRIEGVKVFVSPIHETATV